MADSPIVPESPAPRYFATTRWSIVLNAGRTSSPDADAALETLCHAYWYPLYAFVRRQGRSRDDAQELTQEFFSQVLDRNWLRATDAERGRFRSFLLTMLKRFLAREHKRANSLKRGGGKRVLSLDVDSAENLYRHEPVDGTTPEAVFDRRWALTLLDRVMNGLEAEYSDGARADLFRHCRSYLTGASSAPSYAETGRELGMTEGAVKVAVHRLRKRYRDRLVEEVSQTVSSEDDVQDEIRSLLSAVRGGGDRS